MHKMAEGRKESGLHGSEVLWEPEQVGDSHKAWGTTEEGDLEAAGGVVAGGKGSRRRSALSAAGDRFSPGGSASGGATGDVEACLIEAAKATPRRSSIIKVFLLAALLMTPTESHHMRINSPTLHFESCTAEACP
ncbi:hypothetical protein scyTo_0019696 [Scyliorhinus torazame]|uniref:Uncharacterized protein n=1 Tax=Scyliorhinus torazame TaxID=75743 RepID=A0A401PPA5_SCYTO|nr:hypothetical protein [Scyliorhinus torazame]